MGPQPETRLEEEVSELVVCLQHEERKKEAERRQNEEEARTYLKEKDKESREHKRGWGEDSCSSLETEVDMDKSVNTVDKVGKTGASIVSYTALLKKPLWHRSINVTIRPMNWFSPFQRLALVSSRRATSRKALRYHH